jgi:hypothetical protein
MRVQKHWWIIVCIVLVIAFGFASTVITTAQQKKKPTKKATKKAAQGTPFKPADFSPSCPSPSFPSPFPASAPQIDSLCGTLGSGGREAAQNQAKNDFCASGSAQTITIQNLKTLQTAVEDNTNINFGDEATATRKAGPTQDRTPLRKLGEGNLVTFTGFVLIARQEGAESVNCGKNVEINDPLMHDIHISLVENAETTLANECSSVVAEMIPHHRPDSWTHANVQKVADQKAKVRVTGQQFFDSSHVPCAGGVKVRSNPKRVSLWEIHPIYKFEVCTAKCDGAGTWVPLDEWVKSH